MKTIDINCDLGESFGRYTLGMDETVLPYITSANVACGFHASDPLVMSKTVTMAKENDVLVGAHPGFPDLVGFGRRNIDASAAEIKSMMLYQLGALVAFCKANEMKLHHVKPHGALYNMAAKDLNIARAICEAIADYDQELILLALSGSQMIQAAKEIGIPYASEVFADRAYEEDGTLVARMKQGAVITDEDEAIARVIQMVTKGTVNSLSGKEIAIVADSVCVHGDGVKAVAFAKKINEAMKQNGIQVMSF